MKIEICQYCNMVKSLVEESQKYYEKGFGWIHRDPCYWKRQQDLRRRS